MTSGFGRIVGWLTLLGMLSASTQAKTAPPAKPKQKEQCALTFEKAQEEKNRGKLRHARELLLSCGERSCGKVMQRECRALLDEIKPEIPTIVLSLTDAEGRTISDAEVVVDDKPLAPELDGRPISVDPGPHNFVFTTSDERRVELQATVLPSTQNQKIVATLEPAASAESSASASAEPERKAAPKRKKHKKSRRAAEQELERPSLVAAYVFGGVGLAGVGGFVALQAVARSENQKLSSCWPSCPDARVDRVNRLYIASDISLGIGVAALGTGLILALTAGPSRPREQAKSRARTAYTFDVRQARGGLTAGIRGTF